MVKHPYGLVESPHSHVHVSQVVVRRRELRIEFDRFSVQDLRSIEPTSLPVQDAQAVVEPDVARAGQQVVFKNLDPLVQFVKPAEQVQLPFALSGPAHPEVRVAQVVMRSGLEGVELNRPLKGLDRLRVVALSEVDETKPLIGPRTGGIRGDRLSVRGLGPGIVVPFYGDLREAQETLRTARIRAESSSIGLAGFRILPMLEIDRSEGKMGQGIIGIEFQGLLEVFHGLGTPFHPHQHRGQIVTGGDIVGVELDRSFILRYGLRIIIVFEMGVPQIVVNPGGIRNQLDRLSVRGYGLDVLPAF